MLSNLRNHFACLETGKRPPPRRRCADCNAELFRRSSAKRCGPCSAINQEMAQRERQKRMYKARREQ